MSTALRARIKYWTLRIILVSLASAVTLTALAYAIDFAIFRHRVSTNRQPYREITVSRYYAVPQKSGKTQFIFDPPVQETCANSLFPRSGYVPCWYLQNHTQQRTDM